LSFELAKAAVLDIPFRLRCGALLTAFRRRRSCALVAQLLDPRADRSEIVGGARLGHASSMEEITTGKIVPRETPPPSFVIPKRNEPGGGTPPGSA
jgi:hypothetical protein